jgi:signal transduction histidine kinase
MTSDAEDMRFALDVVEGLLDASSVGFAFLDRELRYVRINQALATIQRLPIEAHIGRRPAELFGERSIGAEALLRYVIATERPYQRVEWTVARPGGEVAHYVSNCCPIRGRRGDIVGVGVAVIDVTLARRAEDALQERAGFLAEVTTLLASSLDYEATFSTLVHLAVPRLADFCTIDALEPDGVIRRVAVAHRDPDKEAAAWAVRAHHGYNPSGPLVRALRSGRSELLAEVTDEYLQSVATHPEQLANFRALGIRSAMFVPLAVRDEVRGVLMLLSTESGRVYTAADLVLAEEVARRAAVAVDHAGMYRAAQQALAQAEAANRGKDDFLATLSHELRTPLNATLGWARLLRGGRLDAATSARAIDAIERSTEAQARLIEDLVDVSRIVAGKLEIVAEPVDLRAVIERASETLRPAANAKRVALRVAPPAATLIVNGDPGRLEQVIRNVIGNAVKFTPAGGSVDVELGFEGGLARITVADTGEGIDPDFLAHVFDRFAQADTGATRAHGGLGLGLAIARHVVSLHGGDIVARSEGRGRGATFIVTLPALAASPPLAASRSVADELHGGRLRGVRVLIVEDDPRSAELTSFVLSAEEAHVRLAGTAREALAAIEAETPTVIVCDIGLPDEDGHALIRRLRHMSGRRARVPAVALTAYARPADRATALDAGFDAYLAKPVEPATLVEVVAGFAQPG